MEVGHGLSLDNHAAPQVVVSDVKSLEPDVGSARPKLGWYPAPLLEHISSDTAHLIDSGQANRVNRMEGSARMRDKSQFSNHLSTEGRKMA
jgi:hypothetical protein